MNKVFKIVGQVLWYSDRDQNGVIKTSEGVEYYFDISVAREILKQSEIFRGQAVKFDLNESIKDCRCAKNVELATVEEFYSAKKEPLTCGSCHNIPFRCACYPDG